MKTNESAENRKSIYNKKIYNKMNTCEICQTNIKKNHEGSNKHKRNINQLLLNNNYFNDKKRFECSTCNQSVINLKIHEKSKKHQRNLIKCDYKNCRTGLNGNFKAYCYTKIKLIDHKIFIKNMLGTIESKIQDQNWKNLKLILSLHVEFYKKLPDENKSIIKNWFNSGTMTSITNSSQIKETIFEMINKIDRKSTRLNSSHSDRSRMPSSA